ncbi:MAG TPA: PPC domain-containing protein [Pyrinomonadaceae bacterium]|nr:PPC domain-containing protein [Pyrinomonadaceae bacterium]
MRQPGQLSALLAAFFYTFLLSTTTVFAQGETVVFARGETTVTQGPALQLGTPVERQLGPKQAHSYTLKVDENTYVQLAVEQRGIDVMVQVTSQTGKSLGDFDSPNGTDGPENVSFVAVTAGTYRIVVTPLNNEDPTSGKYEIKIVEIREATEQELKTSKNLEVVKAKGLALLEDIDGMLAEIRSPQTRIRTQMQVAQFLWAVDEKRASRYLNDAANGLKEFLLVDPTSNEYVKNYSTTMQLRTEIITLLTPHDPEAALAFLRSSRMPLDPYGNEREQANQEMSLELNIASEVAAKDPKRALQIARQNLKKGLSSSINQTIIMLKQKSPELAAEFAGEVVAKIMQDKLLKVGYGAFLAGSFMHGCRPTQNMQKVGLDEAAIPPLLPAETCRELLQKSYQEAISYTPPPPHNYSPERDAATQLLYGLRSLGTDLDTLIAGGSAAVTKKLGELENNPMTQPGYQEAQAKINENGPMDGAFEAIEKVPDEMRDSLYSQLASNLAVKGDGPRARQIINEKIANPFQRRQQLGNIDIQETYQLMARGKVEEALRTINNLRTPRERANLLGQIARQIGPGQKRAAAMNLLEQARAMLAPGGLAQDQEQMTALLELARAFVRYDAKRAFEIAEPLVDQTNEICSAARTLEGFGPEYYQNDELDMQNGNSVSNVVTQISSALGTLAITNFERSKSMADRLRLPEVRLRAYIDIAQQTIQAK